MASVLFPLIATLFVSNAYCRNIGSRIVGGEATTIDKYPYMVSVIYIDSHFCGGSIINSLHVLTAAHCTNRLTAADLFVRGGSTYVNQGGQYRAVAQIFQHQQFDSDTYDYDIAVLRLKDGFALDSKVQAIALPAQSQSDIAGNLLGTATGWGRLSENGMLPMELQKVELPTIEHSICELVYGDSLTTRMFCAGYVQGLKDTCQGDSGGPYAYNGVLLGVTSWGDGCGASNSPGAYTKVAYFRSYIDGIVNN